MLTILINQQTKKQYTKNKQVQIVTTTTATTTMTAYNNNTSNFDDEVVVYLPNDFVPGPNHVVCARGKGYWNHSGNVRYRNIISSASQRYAQTTNKLDKSLIVSEIIHAIESEQGNNNGGSYESGFVKKEGKRFVLCDEHFMREKITQSLRDGLKDMYKSSTSTKKSRRTFVCQSIHERVETAIRSNGNVSYRMQKLSYDLATTVAQQQQNINSNNSNANDADDAGYSSLDDDVFCNMLSCANSDILSAIKADRSLLRQYEQFSQEANTLATAGFSVLACQ